MNILFHLGVAFVADIFFNLAVYIIILPKYFHGKQVYGPVVFSGVTVVLYSCWIFYVQFNGILVLRIACGLFFGSLVAVLSLVIFLMIVLNFKGV